MNKHKQMKTKILLTNFTLGSLGGTQTWVQTMAKELAQRGFDIYLFAGDNNYSVIGTAYTQFDPSVEYDIALINHNTCLTALEGVKIKKKIFTSHGILPELEQPVEGADFYVAVSEEVQENLKKQGFDATVIRNPIDLDVYYPTRAFTHFPQPLRNVVYMSNYQGGCVEVIKEACKKLNINLKVYGKNEPMPSLQAFREADLVIGLGRTAYEAMAMNKNVIIFDYNGADGFVTPETILEFRKNNCSGRRHKIKLDADGLVELFKKFDYKMQMRKYIADNNDVKLIVSQYLQLADMDMPPAKPKAKVVTKVSQRMQVDTHDSNATS